MSHTTGYEVDTIRLSSPLIRSIAVLGFAAALVFGLVTAGSAQEVPAEVVTFDVKPKTCPNPIQPDSGGNISAAIMGTTVFDVTGIDPLSLFLTVEGPVAVDDPIRVTPRSVKVVDVGRPFPREDALDCQKGNKDRIDDLLVQFETEGDDGVGAAVEEAFGGRCDEGDVMTLTVHGTLNDGTTAIVGEDFGICVDTEPGPKPF